MKFPKSPRADAWYEKTPSPRWSPYEIYSFYRDHHGTMWFGTANLGICRFDGMTHDWMYESHLTELPNDAMFGIRSIIEDADGAFWFCNTNYRYRMASRAGVNAVDGAITYTRQPGIDLSGLRPGREPIFFQSIVDDDEGDLWMATYGDGVWRYDRKSDGTKMKHYIIKEAGVTVTLISIYRDRHGDLWLGTQEHGAWRFNGEAFERFRPK